MLDLAFIQRLAGDTAGANVTAEQARNTLEPLCKEQPDNSSLLSTIGSGSCRARGERLRPKEKRNVQSCLLNLCKIS